MVKIELKSIKDDTINNIDAETTSIKVHDPDMTDAERLIFMKQLRDASLKNGKRINVYARRAWNHVSFYITPAPPQKERTKYKTRKDKGVPRGKYAGYTKSDKPRKPRKPRCDKGKRRSADRKPRCDKGLPRPKAQLPRPYRRKPKPVKPKTFSVSQHRLLERLKNVIPTEQYENILIKI